MNRVQKSIQLSKEAIASLSDRLPTGYLEIIQGKVLNDKGQPYTKAYISYVKNGDRLNDEIMNALLDLAEETDEKKSRAEARALNKG